MTATLFVRFRAVGFHYWPNAPVARRYLAEPHRHLFHIEVQVDSPVDNSRSIEFHDLLDDSQRVWRDIAARGTTNSYADMSCESIADAMARRLSRVHDTVVTVSVSEDGECGAIVSVDNEA